MQLLALIYTTCTGACPMTVKSMQMFSRNMPADIKGRIRFLLVTVDPETRHPPGPARVSARNETGPALETVAGVA